MHDTTERPLRSGDRVEVRSAAEILATLDANGELASLPFMPEMIPFIGRRYLVDRRAEKICDTICYTGSRRLYDTVLLEDLRCDGAAHAGCQAECRIFWKEAWLRRVRPGEPEPELRPTEAEALRALAEVVRLRTTRAVEADGEPETRHLCQATELLRASTRLCTFDPRPYVREFTCGNVSLGKCVQVSARAAVQEPLRKLGLVPEIHLEGSRDKALDDPPLCLKPGDWVQVKSPEEIRDRLNRKGRNRGLWFDREMLPYCGGTYRVRRRVNRFIDEQTGKMVELKTDAVTLEGVVCSGDHSLRRWFCPRGIYPYWRESWLRRAEAPTGAQEEHEDEEQIGEAKSSPGR